MKKEGNSSRMEFWGTLKREIRIKKKNRDKEVRKRESKAMKCLRRQDMKRFK